MNAKQIYMIAIYSEMSEVSRSKAQQLDTSIEIHNEINQLEVKKLIDKDFSSIKNIDWQNPPKVVDKYVL